MRDFELIDSTIRARAVRPLIHPLLAFVVILSFCVDVLSATDTLGRFEASLPRRASDCDAQRLGQLTAAAARLESQAAAWTWNQEDLSAAQLLETIERLVAARERLERCDHTVVELRSQFATLGASNEHRQTVRDYLAITSAVIDVSGRLRYLLRDAIDNATYALDPTQGDFDKLLDILQEHKVEVGADAMAFMLFDPPSESGLQPFPAAMKKKVIRLMRSVRKPSSVVDLAQFLHSPALAPELAIEAAEAIRDIGLPQDPRPDETADPPPPLTARQLQSVLAALKISSASRELVERRDRLMVWLEQRATKGITGDRFPYGRFAVRSGDWLLMRNPSPYNLFTDLSPGLFTHVGVVTTEVGRDGVRRFVIVDLPERGDRIPATNVDAYLSRTLHFFFLRHRRPDVGRRMGEAARAVIGNESQFDLLFRTRRVEELQGKPLAGARIHTYCAGFLLLCAQETGLPREDFFPITEAPAGGFCLSNLETLGLSIGEQFVSPTGAVFSPNMLIVGSCEPMYDPTREIKEAIYDHFARRMRGRHLVTSPDAAQMLVEKLAHLSQANPWLKRALARANQVSEHMDLEAAAKTAAVVETLDEIANTCVDEFLQARAAVISSDLPAGERDAMTVQQRVILQRYQERHAKLVVAWSGEQLSPLDVRRQLVRFYIDQGTRQLDARFFPAE